MSEKPFGNFPDLGLKKGSKIGFDDGDGNLVMCQVVDLETDDDAGHVKITLGAGVA